MCLVKHVFLPIILLASGLAAMATDATRLETIRKLASESYAERVEATRELWQEGASAKEALMEAAKSRDPEMAMRARDLLRKIDLDIRPDTDPKIIELMERYRGANQTQKSTIFHELRRLRAWRQILRLYAREADPSIRQSLAGMVDGIALHAARESIVLGDPDGALEYLEMTRASSAGSMALAAFHRSRGTLDQEIEAMDDPQSREDFIWLAALHRAGDDPANAARFARKAGDERLAAAMEMLMGNPLAWMDHEAVMAERRNEDQSARYARAAAARWRGESTITSLNAIRRQLREENSMSRETAMAQLFLLGDVDTAWKYFIHNHPEEAFASFDSFERVGDAITTLGLDPEKPDFEGYFKPMLEKIRAPRGIALDDDEAREALIGKFIMVCSFIERRGGGALLDQWAVPGLLEFAAEHERRFIDLMNELFGVPSSRSGAPEMAGRIAAQWAGDQDGRWNEMVIAAFGEEREFSVWWELLEKVGPDVGHAERMDAMLAIFGYTRDTAGLYTRWLDAVFEHAADAANDGHALEALGFLANHIIDIEFIGRLHAMHDGEEEAVGEQTYGSLVIDAALDRWDAVAEVFLAQIAVLTERGDSRAEMHAYAAACLRRAGRIAEADVHESWVETLALGEPRANLAIAQAFSFGRDYDRAARWYRRAVIESGFNDNQFSQQALRGYVSELLERREFALIASCSEVLAHLDSLNTSYGVVPALLTRVRQQADFARALAMPDDRRDEAEKLLREAHAIMPTDGALADHFFPSLLESPHRELHDELFEISWAKLTSSLEGFPDADNTMNTAVWFASRSARRLEEAKEMQERALELYPRSPAYLDTLAEVYFAMGDREEAVRYGRLALRFMPHDTMIIRQYERFLHGALPVP